MSAQQGMIASRTEELERDLNLTVRKSKSGRWKTQKGRRGTIIRNWFMDNTNTGPATNTYAYHCYQSPCENGDYSNQHWNTSSLGSQKQDLMMQNQRVASSYGKNQRPNSEKGNNTKADQKQGSSGRPGLPAIWHQPEPNCASGSGAMNGNEEVKETQRMFDFLDDYDKSHRAKSIGQVEARQSAWVAESANIRL